MSFRTNKLRRVMQNNFRPAFTALRLFKLLPAMIRTARLNTNIYEMLQVSGSFRFLSDCETFYQDARAAAAARARSVSAVQRTASSARAHRHKTGVLIKASVSLSSHANRDILRSPPLAQASDTLCFLRAHKPASQRSPAPACCEPWSGCARVLTNRAETRRR